MNGSMTPVSGTGITSMSEACMAASHELDDPSNRTRPQTHPLQLGEGNREMLPGPGNPEFQVHHYCFIFLRKFNYFLSVSFLFLSCFLLFSFLPFSVSFKLGGNTWASYHLVSTIFRFLPHSLILVAITMPIAD